MNKVEKALKIRQIDRLLAEYGESHRDPTNKMIHWVCVPIIFWTVVAFLYGIKFTSIAPIATFQINAAVIVLALVEVYYVMLSPPLAAGMLVFGSLCLYLAQYAETALKGSSYGLWSFAFMLFVLAWIGQFYGHKVEGRKPSFLKDLQFLLVGPAWLMHFIFKSAGIAY